MLRRAATAAVTSSKKWLTITSSTHHRHFSSPSASSQSNNVSLAVNSMILRSLKDHYLEVSNMAPPPKVSPPDGFTIVQGALDSNGPVLKKEHNNEEISISVMRLANFVSAEADEDDDDGGVMNQLFLHVDVAKPGQERSLNFLCGLYPDALGIHSVALRPKTEDGFVMESNKYTGPLFENLDEKTRDAFHNYIEERGINESLFKFLQAWLYVKDHRNLLQWFRSVASAINERETGKVIAEGKSAPAEAKAA